jgi:phospholipase C
MLSRRDFLQRAAMLSGSLGSFAGLPPSVLRALEIEPKEGTTFMDAEHVVILMQENRSFDHAFGTYPGVRGFDDPRAVTTPGGNPVWLQTNPAGETYAPFPLDIHGTKITWMGDLPHDRGSEVAAGNRGKHDQWLKVMRPGNKNYRDMPITLGYYESRDIPFYHAFADAFTLCDQHFCSAQTCTTPNRLFLWTGTNRDPRNPDAPIVFQNGQADHDSPVDWPTFPERLEECGVSWKIYQNEITLPTGLTGEEQGWLGNFGDNPMEYFSQYHVEFSPNHVAHLRQRAEDLRQRVRNLEAGDEIPEENIDLAKAKTDLAGLEAKLQQLTPENFQKLTEWERNLHQKAFVINSGDPDYRKLTTLTYHDGETERTIRVPAGDLFHQFRKDVDEGKLPAVSWLVAPGNFSDHPGVPWFGAWYVSEALDILTRNPEVWRKTIFILTYDENDGYYDHVPPFVPPHTADPETGAASAGLDTRDEFDPGGDPIGLGYRVPMIIASPWSRGGNVCSEVFDHTSVLQFLEGFLKGRSAKPVEEANISAWRRTVCGDLTSAFLPAGNGSHPNPQPLKRDEFVESIHRAQFKNPPSDFRSLTDAEIAEIRQDPAGSPLLPKQKPGVRPSMPLPYELHADGELSDDRQTFSITFRTGEKSVGAPFQVYAPGNYGVPSVNGDAPAEGGAATSEAARRWSFAVAKGRTVRHSWPVSSFENGIYHLRVYGPNGFYREFRGTTSDPMVRVVPGYFPGKGPAIGLGLANRGSEGAITCAISDASYGKSPVARDIAAGAESIVLMDLKESSGWYDVTLSVTGDDKFSRHYAGRIETGKPGTTDPLIGGRSQKIAKGDDDTKPAQQN